jgi:hypothetical protein
MKRNSKWKSNKRGADSKWEADLRDGVLKDTNFKYSKIKYSIDHIYNPDFTYQNSVKGLITYVEAKGRFLDISEASKYIWIRQYLSKNHEELIFLFYNPETPMPNAKKRKDGTKRTHREWAEKNNFKWFTEHTILEYLSGDG